jgi:PKD repeat protein
MKKKYLFSFILSIVTFLTLNAQISFTADVTSGCGPLAVNFTNTSSNPSAVNWDWSFGDGSSNSNVFSPSHVYNNGGSFTVWLSAFDASWNFLGDYNIQIDVIGAPQMIQLPNDSVCPNDNVFMYINGLGSTWEWDFGDGNTYTENSNYGGVQHTYTTPGMYTLSCNVTNTCGTYYIDTIITVANNVGFATLPYLNISGDSACPNALVSMWTDGGYSAYSWDFGDGNFGFGNNTSNAYTSIGTYPITLDITNGCGNTATLYDTIVVHNNVPVTGEYIWEVDSVCPGEEFNIQATSNNGVNYVWDFDDGNPTVSGNYVNYTYTAMGTYNVTLTITNDCGNSLVVPTQIVVTNTAPINNAYIQYNSNSLCPGDALQYWVNNNYSYFIDFGDGTGTSSNSNNDWEHVYNNAGTYPISVVYQNACGNSLTVYDTIYVQNNLPFIGNPYVGLNQNPLCINSTADFYTQSGYASYLWDFGDGGSSTNKDAEHTYNTAGNYNVSVTITNGCGASSVFYVTANILSNLPVTNFDYQIMGDSVCPNDELLFIGDDWDGLTYLWDFGDGNTSTTINTTHAYANVGTYVVTITGTNGCGNDSIAYDTVIVDNNVFPSAANIQVFVQEEGCIGDDLYFVVGPANSGTYTWDFGDGNSTTQTTELLTPEGITYDVAQHSYSAAGIYDIYFSVTNGCGNTYFDTLQVTVGTVGDTVDMEVSFWWNDLEASCQGEPIEFVGVGASSYSWNFGDGSGILITSGSLVPVYHTYMNPGAYNVTVTGHNQCGNSDTRTEEIFIPQSLIDITTNAVQLANCGQADGIAVVSATGGMPPYQYQWSNGDNSVIADSLSSGLYIITVTDNNDCSSEGMVTVSDNQGPTILVDNITHMDCYGQSNGTISVTILGGAPPYDVIWSNGDQTEDIFNLVAGPYEIFVTDANDCMAMKSIEVTQPIESVVSVVTQPSVCGGNNGGALAVINNGAAPYNYIWPNLTGPVAQTGGLAPGIYDLLVIDANTCLLQQEFVISESGAPIIMLDSIITGTCSGNLSSIYINTIGGVGPFIYDWSDGSTNQDLINVLPGNYTVEVTGQNGCSSYLSETLEMTLPEENPLCVVTVDTNIGGNIVVWEPVQTTGVDYYNVYKESSQSGLYYLIGSTDADSLSFYHDVNSNPQIRSWRYKIGAVDDCGNESEISGEHKTIHLSANLGVGGVVNLIWDNYEGFNYSTFYINRYHPTTGWQLIDSIASNLNSFTDALPPNDSNLIYAVTINSPSLCSAQKSQNHNTTRSNQASINGPSTPASINEYSSMGVSLYPNPTDGTFTLFFGREAEGVTVDIFDMQGKLLNNIAVAKDVGTKQFDISEYDKGMYLVKVHSDKNVEYIKVIKQ